MGAVLSEESLKQELETFPSTFDLYLTNLNKDCVKNIIRKLEDDRDSTRKLEAEDIQISNFLSYLYFHLGDYEHAHQHIEESLQKDPDNIIANTNKARILLEEGEISDVEDIIAKLQKLKGRDDFDRRKCYAEADLAYVYSRSGPWYHKKAVNLFTRVVAAYPTEYAWQFGLGLTLLRHTHWFISQAEDKLNPRQNEETTIHAAELFLTVATESDDPVLRANAYVRLGKAVFIILKNNFTNVPDEVMRLKPKEYFEKAVEICPEEPSVLETCGQFARYRGELDLSETLLRKALQIKPTCHAYHHLALTLTRRVTGRSYKGQSERIRLRQMTKSPLEVFVYPENELLVEAINLLEKTEKLSVCWFIIQYDKGIIYRMLGQIEKAVKVFKQIVSKKKNLPIKLLMTIVYEQLGLCLIELSKCDEISPDIQQRYKRDGQAHLLHAIQLQPEIVANDPQFKEAWNSYPTLKELFSDERDGKPRQLAVLHMRMGNHRDAIDIYKKLYLKENDKMKPEDCVNMLKCYQKEGQLEECVFLLRSWECTTLFSGLPPSLIFDVYIDCAFHAYTTDNAQLAYQHFRRAFKVYGMFDKPNDKQTTEEDENTKEILILHSCALKWKCKHPRNLGTILEDVTGLRYTINSDDVLPNALVQESMVTIIQKMACIIIMTHDSAEVYDKLYVNLAIRASSGKSGPQVLVVSDDERHMPDIASTKSFIRIPPPLEGAMDQNKQISEEHREWIKEFITKITDLS